MLVGIRKRAGWQIDTYEKQHEKKYTTAASNRRIWIVPLCLISPPGCANASSFFVSCIFVDFCLCLISAMIEALHLGDGCSLSRRPKALQLFQLSRSSLSYGRLPCACWGVTYRMLPRRVGSLAESLSWSFSGSQVAISKKILVRS